MADVRVIVGKRGSGKSCALRDMLSREPRAVLYDTLREPTYDKFTRIGSFPELCKFLAANPAVFRVAYSWDGVASHEVDFDRACRAAYACRRLTFAVDEVDLFTSPSYIPRPFDRLVSLGRHRELSVWVATRRPKEVHPLIRSQANMVVSFAQTEPADLEWSRQVMGSGADRLPALRLYERVVWTDAPPARGETGNGDSPNSP